MNANPIIDGLKKNSWRNSLRTRQLSILSLFLCVSVLLSVVLYFNATKVAKQSIYDKMNSQADFYVDSIDQQLQNIKNMMYDVFSSRNLAFLVYPESTLTDYERRDAILTEQERLSSLKNSSLLVASATLYLPNANLKISDNLAEAMTDEDFLFLKEHFDSTDQIMNFEDNKLFMLSKGAPDQLSFQKTDVFFYVELNREKLNETLASFNTLDNSGSFLYQSSEDILIHSANGKDYAADILPIIRKGQADYGYQAESIKLNNEKFLTVIRKSDIFGAFVQYNREKEVLRSLAIYKWLVLFYIVIMSFLALIFSVYTERNIHKPLIKLLRAFSKVQDEDLRSGSRLKLNKGNEFNYLYDGFNQMTQEIKNLVEEVYIHKNLTQKAELKQLQSQINPHFLYNSFFSLSRKIKRGDTSGAEAFAAHLGVFFRFLTKNDSDNVILHKEIEHARSYTSIQHTRFSDRIQIDFEELPEQFADLLVPRLILQPIIENAFEHGLENKEADGYLRVSFVHAHPFLEIHVEDNGSEVDWVKLEKIISHLDSEDFEEVTALINIHKRLKIHFGISSGLVLQRGHLGGLEVIIRMLIQTSRSEV
ncbi:HAMP domain-containing protein [Paenibacillus sp. LMG 31459]|uniref:HAMP domain-containing protein n=1 Tax=Paenibacillus phytohabitans TaxID=2654978 RepID=A0ABX1YGK5_9BACL|nr:histidine kinase [Paenibacillus phytohabitans]NOU79013.1 HAMP domain-containing protein [Paenibacillus phytohabitans]